VLKDRGFAPLSSNEGVASVAEREALRADALDLGFLQVGFAPAATPAHFEDYLDWLREGRHGEMVWLAREDAVRRRSDPEEALPGCRTLVVVTMGYAAEPFTPGPDHHRARIARYAGGVDYHRRFEERLGLLAELISDRWPSAGVKPYVDYGPVLEREHAQRAGLGWIGKNTMLIHPRLGSWTLLGELLTTVAIPPDDAFDADRCGTCVRCLEACPTGAITAARKLDARLCISYLTIELRGSIPESLRPAIGNRVFGCDICQEVCPWNDGITGPRDTGSTGPWGRPIAPEGLTSWAEELLDLSDEQFRALYADTALARPGREGLLRNLCVGMGNSGDPAVVPTLMRCFDEPSAVIREHAAWALGRVDAGRHDSTSR